MADTDTLTSYDFRIRAAYQHALRDLGRDRGDYVSLTDLRPYVGGCRELVDAALRRMGRGDYPGQDVHLVPEANQKTLSQLDRSAAVELGGQPLHKISIRS